MFKKMLAKTLTFFVIAVLAICQSAYSQQPKVQVLWKKTFGGSKTDQAGRNVQQTTDGGYIITGWTSSYGAGSSDFWLIKTDADGNEEWNQTFGGSMGDYRTSGQQTSDGGYVIIGQTNSFPAPSERYCDAWIVKTDANGSKEWSQTYGGNVWDFCTFGRQVSDGGYVITGYTDSFSKYGWRDIWLVKTDANGTQQWIKVFGGSVQDEGYYVQQTKDGEYIIAGGTRVHGVDGSQDALLIKTDANGNQEWKRTYGGSADDVFINVQQTGDGGYIASGRTYSYGAGDQDIWLVKTDANGVEEWNKTFGGSDLDNCSRVLQTTDGGYIIAGYTCSYGNGSGDVWLIKTDANGNEEWDMTIGGSNNDGGVDIQQTSDGGYIVLGNTESYGAGGRDIWLIRLAPEGGPAKGIEVSIPSLTADAGSSITVPINVDNAKGIAGGKITLTFDQTILTAKEAKQTALNNIPFFQPNVMADKVTLTMAGTKGIAGGSGAIAEIVFEVSATAKGGAKSPLTFTEAKLYDELGKDLPAEVVNGSVTVKAPSVAPTPIITKIEPSSGPADGGTAITITGENFADGAIVTIGGKAATDVNVVSANEIIAKTPASSEGTADIVVTNPDGKSATLADGFSYTSGEVDECAATFVITGIIYEEDGKTPLSDGIDVTVKNLTKNTSQTSKTGSEGIDGGYTVNFLDFQTNAAACVGDEIEVTVSLDGRSGKSRYKIRQSDITVNKAEVNVAISSGCDGTFEVNYAKGINLISVPFDPSETWRVSDLMKYIGSEASMIIWYDKEKRKFTTFMPNFPETSPANATVNGGEGYILMMMKDKEVTYEGKAWQNVGMSSGCDGTFGVNYAKGINLISVPLDLGETWRMSDLLKYIGSEASMIIWYDKEKRKFTTFMPNFPETSPANATVNGGEGYILMMMKDKEITYEGEAWKNVSGILSPTVVLPESSDIKTPIFAVTGVIQGQDGSYLDGINVTVCNLNTGQKATVVTGTTAGRGRYVVTLTDFTEGIAARIDDTFSISVAASQRRFTNDSVKLKITRDDIQSANVTFDFILEPLPEKTVLLQNYPNPFNPDTWIPFKLSGDSEVKVSIYDGKGQLVRFIDLGAKPAGVYLTRDKAAYWDGRNDRGEKVASGLYFYQLKAGDFSATLKMVIVK